MSILGYYWKNAETGSWQDFLNQGTWFNYTVNDQTISSEVFTIPVKEVNFTCNDTTISNESFSVFAARKDYYTSMTDHLPDYYRLSTDVDIFKKMAESELKELGYKNSQINEAIHVSNATSNNIDRFEKEYGLNTDNTIGFINRKNVLLANHYAVYNDSTEEALRKSLELLGATSVTFSLNPARHLTVLIVIDDVLLIEAQKLTRKMIGAHLGLTITTLNTWDFVLNDGNGDWQNALDNYTWNNILIQ